MAEVMERVAKLEEQFDGVSQHLANLEASIARVEDRLDARLARVEGRLDSGLAEIRLEMHTQFRWIMGGIGSATLAILLAIISQMLFGD